MKPQIPVTIVSIAAAAYVGIVSVPDEVSNVVVRQICKGECSQNSRNVIGDASALAAQYGVYGGVVIGGLFVLLLLAMEGKKHSLSSRQRAILQAYKQGNLDAIGDLMSKEGKII